MRSLPERCVNGVRLVCWNIGSLTARYHDILALRPTFGVDLVCVQELGRLDPVLFLSLRKMRGFQYARIWYCARPGGRGGGVAFISLNPALEIQVVSRLSRGGLTIRVRAPGFAPFAITNCYIPPSNSVYGKDADAIRAWLLHEQARLRGTLGLSDHLFAADWNDRQGSVGRVTQDQSRASARTIALQNALSCSPALGRGDGELAATFTSRSLKSDRRDPRELAEIDGFWCSAALPTCRLGGLAPDERPTWSNYFVQDAPDALGPRLPGDFTHLPVFLDFQPVPVTEPVTPRRRRRRPARDSYTPVYVDRSWAQRAAANIAHLSKAIDMAANPQASLEDLHAMIRDATLAAAREVHPQSAHAPTPVYRLFHNMTMPTPAAFVNDAVKARQLASKGKRLCQRARLANGLTDAERASLTQAGKLLLTESGFIRRRANTLAAGVTQRWRAQLSHALDRARRLDPHHLWQMVISELTLADPHFLSLAMPYPKPRARLHH